MKSQARKTLKKCSLCNTNIFAKLLCKKHYHQEYRQRPEVKQQEKEYRQRPEVKQREKEYRQRPEFKQRRKEYYQRPEFKQRRKEYYQRPEVKQRMREYYKRPEVKRCARKSRIKSGNLQIMLHQFKRISKKLSKQQRQLFYKSLIKQRVDLEKLINSCSQANRHE